MKIVIALLALALLSACQFYTGQEDWDYYTPCDFESASLSDAAAYCRDHIEIAEDWEQYDWTQYGRVEYWATPEETLRNGKGDCEDFSGVFGYLAYSKLGVTPVFHITREVSTGNRHMIVETPGHYPYYWFGTPPGDTWKIEETYTYGQMMWICENTHGSYAGGRSID
jgi:hypothetical protein